MYNLEASPFRDASSPSINFSITSDPDISKDEVASEIHELADLVVTQGVDTAQTIVNPRKYFFGQSPAGPLKNKISPTANIPYAIQ